MTLVILTALGAEAATFVDQAGANFVGRAYRVQSCGIGQRRADAATVACIADGCSAILSWGLAGGLDSALRPGTLLVGDSVAADSGESWLCDAELREQLLTRLARLHAVAGTLASVEQAVTNPADKTALAHARESTIVDMESAAMARRAAVAGLPFAVVRCVVDPADFTLPRAALAGMRADGRAAPWATCMSLLRHPGEIGDLLRLAGWYRGALRQLARAARELTT